MIKRFIDTYIISIYSLIFSSLIVVTWENTSFHYLCLTTIWGIGAYFGYLMYENRKYLIRSGTRLHLFNQEVDVISLNDRTITIKDQNGKISEVSYFWAVLGDFVFKVEDVVEFFIIERVRREIYYRKLSGKIIDVLDAYDGYIIETVINGDPLILRGISKRFILYKTA